MTSVIDPDRPSLPSGLLRGTDGVVRCWWCGQDPLYQAYHDREWGFPVRDDRLLFELLSLEGFQSGLSWLTILRKRDAFRHGFAGFDVTAIARFGPEDVARLLADAGIVRHRGKIEALINNARRCLDLLEREPSLASFIWRYEPDPGSRPAVFDHDALLARPESPESKALSKALKQRGWGYVGPTTVYAFMQAAGLVNDHLEGCAAQPLAHAARQSFSPPR
jgi:DNA-3-methyladenine glycosylase I